MLRTSCPGNSSVAESPEVLGFFLLLPLLRLATQRRAWWIMVNLLLTISVLTLRLPNPDSFETTEWKPVFTKAVDLKLEAPTVAFLTHASRHFDPLGITKPAIVRVTAAMKNAGLPVVCLHDRFNDKNPAWMYLYSDRRPTAFVSSDVGNIDLDFTSVRHVVSLGGYFGQCQRSTVEDAVRCWRRDAPEHDFRVTQIVDGIFCVSEFMKGSDPYYFRVREALYDDLRKRHPKAVISIERTLQCISSQDLKIDFISRQIPPVPADVNVVIDFFGHSETVQAARLKNAATLTFAYRRSTQFLNYTTVVADPNNVSDRKIRRRSSTIGRRFIR